MVDSSTNEPVTVVHDAERLDAFVDTYSDEDPLLNPAHTVAFGTHEKLDKATAKRDGPGDFAKWIGEGKRAPRSTVFIPGNHEDFEFLGKLSQSTEILPGLIYLPVWQGFVTGRLS